MKYEDERDEAAERNMDGARKRFSRTNYPHTYCVGFSDGADWALESSVVKTLVESIERYQKLYHPDQIYESMPQKDLREALAAYQEAIKEMK